MPQLSLIRVIKVDAMFGSAIQHDVSMKILRELLEAWKTNVELADNKNRVTIDYGSDESQIDPTVGRVAGGCPVIRRK